jgi:MatE
MNFHNFPLEERMFKKVQVLLLYICIITDWTVLKVVVFSNSIRAVDAFSGSTLHTTSTCMHYRCVSSSQQKHRIITLLYSSSDNTPLTTTNNTKQYLIRNNPDSTIQQPTNTNIEVDTESYALERNNKSILVVKKQQSSKLTRFVSAFPGQNQTINNNTNIGSSWDGIILKTAIPSMINLAAVPLVNTVDTYWVGRLGLALALAGQAAANQCFFFIFFLVNYLPTVTAPIVASAVGSGNYDEARDRVCESIFLCNILGLIGTIILITKPELVLQAVVAKDSPVMQYAIPYLRLRSISMIPALLSATGFAAFRGLLDTVTPLKVSLGTK